MEFKNKKELCDSLNQVVAITRLTVKDLIGEAKTLEEATVNFEKKVNSLIEQSTNLVIIKELRKVVYNSGMAKHFKSDYDTEYERLMGWIVSDYQGHSKSDKKLLNEHNLVMNVSSMDMHCVIGNRKDYMVFKKDLEQRVGKRFA